MLTGDENIIDMNFFVQWRIDNATNYLFSIKDSYKDLIVKTAIESVMRQVISGVNIWNEPSFKSDFCYLIPLIMGQISTSRVMAAPVKKDYITIWNTPQGL